MGFDPRLRIRDLRLVQEAVLWYTLGFKTRFHYMFFLFSGQTVECR